MKKPEKHIIHVAESFGSGIVEFVRSLAEGMPDYKHTVIYAIRELSLDEIKSKFTVKVDFIEWEHAQKSISPIKDWKALLYLYKILKKTEFDVLHLHSSKAGLLGRMAGLFFRKKNIIYTPNGAPFNRKDISFFKKLLFISVEFFGSLLSGKTVCCSASEQKTYRKIAIKALCVNNGISIPDATVEKEMQKDEGIFRIVTSGRVSVQKNPDLFYQIATYFANDPSIGFTWIGNGDIENKLNAPNIHLTGWLKRPDVLDILKKADLYLSTALWEGLPFAVLDAMSLGKPLLLNHCVGNIDMVDQGENGYIFENANQAIEKIRYLKNQAELLKNMGYNSYKKCRSEFDIHKTIDSYIQIYNS